MYDRLTVQCPACHAPMVERENRQNGSRFLGCSNYPTCMETAKIPAFIEVKRAGGIELPGFGEPDR
jgi:ssDNA-binding Zn-finger/Zn-ribbon topoisomerase 1